MNARVTALEAAVRGGKGVEYGYPTASPDSSTNTTQEKQPRQVQFDESNIQDWNGADGSMHRDNSNDPTDLQDSNDGMEAIVFTDEENCGFFGM